MRQGYDFMKLSKKNADNTPETITDYIPIATPSIYVMLALMLLGLIVVFVWGNIGRVPLKFTVKGVGLNYGYAYAREAFENGETDEVDEIDAGVDTFLCLINPNIITGDKIDEKPATVILNDGTHIGGFTTLIDTVPLNEEELFDELEGNYLDSHWARERLDTGGYRYLLAVTLDEELSFLQYGEIADVVIEIDQVPPLYYLRNEDKNE